MTQIEIVPCLSDNYAYLIKSGAQCAILDPSEPEPVRAALARTGWKLTHILNTHHHLDHCGGNLALKEETGAQIVGPGKDAARIPGLKPTKTAAEIGGHERALAHEIREAREGATQGNIFTPEIAAQFRVLIGETMKGPSAARIRESLNQASPVWLSGLRVNMTYPHDVPLQSSPPTLLMNLPALPAQLEYRVVGRSLILRDLEANLVVDFLRDAIQ